MELLNKVEKVIHKKKGTRVFAYETSDGKVMLGISNTTGEEIVFAAVETVLKKNEFRYDPAKLTA